MEKLLQTISGAEMFSFLDGFSGYNQVLVVELDRLKTSFGKKWGTFTFRQMWFGIVNVSATL